MSNISVRDARSIQSGMPIPKHMTAWLMPIYIIEKITGVSVIKPRYMPTAIAFITTGGTAASHIFGILYVSHAAARVAALPMTISIRPNPPAMFERKQPINSPGIASGMKNGSNVSASATLNCIGPNESGESATVSAAYKAAIIPETAIFLIITKNS